MMKKLLVTIPVLLLLAVLLTPAPAQISETWSGGVPKWENNTAASGTQGGFGAVANTIRLFGFTTSTPINFSHIVFNVSTADTAAGSLCGAFADCYDVGIYNATAAQQLGQNITAGTLLAHCAAMALNTTGVQDCTTVEGVEILQPGAYYFGFTGSAATAAITYASGNITFLSGGGPTAGGTTTNGVLNSSVTPPADTWTLGSAKNIIFGLHN